MYGLLGQECPLKLAAWSHSLIVVLDLSKNKNYKLAQI